MSDDYEGNGYQSYSRIPELSLDKEKQILLTFELYISKAIQSKRFFDLSKCSDLCSKVYSIHSLKKSLLRR